MIVLEDILFLAGLYDWTKAISTPYFREVSFEKSVGLSETNRLTIYYFKDRMTVTSNLYHPKLGRTQLIRKNVDMALLERIFEDPRTHTNKGFIKQ